MKKVISALLLVCMLMSLCAVGAYAEGDVTLAIKNKNITLDLNTAASNNTAQITVDITGDIKGAGGSWTPTDKSIVTATVDGLITAKKVGTTTVTGKIIKDGEELASDTANVEVINSTLQSVSIDSSSITTVPNDGTNTLALSGIVTSVDGKTVNDNVSTGKWEWTSSNAAVTVTGLGSTASVKSSTPDATANITLKVTDKYGQTMTSEALAVTVASAAPAPAPVVADGITLKATPDTLTIGSSTNTSQLTAYYNGKTEAISGVTWNQVSTSGANVATLDASTGVVTAGSAAGTVKYHAVIGGKEITTAEVTVTVRANNIIEFDVAGFYNSVSSFTVTAKGGVLQLVASNARLKSSPSTQIPGTFNFNWVPATGDPSNGIEVTNLGSGKATAYGRYNGSYSLAVTFTPNDTATYPVTTQNHTVIVNYTPSIIKGNYGVWDGTNGLDFLVNDHISNWSGQVWVDGNLLSDANYVCRGSSDGQIWVTLTPAFISWLRQYYNGNGIHTITVGVDGRNAATGYFKTWGTASSFNGVKTGDDANLGLWAALLGVSAVGAAAAVVIYKRKKANG